MLRLAPRRSFDLALGPAGLILAVWVFLWAWVLLDVVAPLGHVQSSLGSDGGPRVVERA
jgi:hypothetical protein